MTVSLYEDRYAFLSCVDKFFLNKTFFRQICTENQNVNFMSNNFFPKVVPIMR